MSRHELTERFFTTWDGTNLFYRAWRPSRSSDRALVLFHRGHEHSGRFQELVERLDLEDFWIFAWDQRGHGRSPGERGWAESLSAVLKDADGFVRHLSREYSIPIYNMTALGYSVGSVLVAAWVHDYAPPLRAMVLGTPAFRVKLYIPLALSLLRLKQRLFGKSFVKSYVKSKMLTHDTEQASAYNADPLISRNIAVNILIDLFDVSDRLLKDAGAIRVPTLILGAGSDWVVHLSAQRKFFERLSSPVKVMETYEGFHQAVFHEKDRQRPIARTREFILEAFRNSPSRNPSPPQADRDGYTKQEFDRLSQPLHTLSPRRVGYAMQRGLLKSVGRLSSGIQIGWQTGFDSGQSLDYVYANTSRGITPLGRWIDRAYLNSIGWRGIRRRKENLQKFLEAAIARVGQIRNAVRIVDIASGPGRYLLEVLRKSKHPECWALLRDWNENALEAGRALAREMGVDHVTYAKGDAFDPVSLRDIHPRCNIGIISGLYELFPDNERVFRSLRGLREALAEDSLLIYTNQPWHPQMEFIARVLINREGKPWIMRRRTQEEMDELVRNAGFEKEQMEIDEWGIFTVSLARKRSSPISAS